MRRNWRQTYIKIVALGPQAHHQLGRIERAVGSDLKRNVFSQLRNRSQPVEPLVAESLGLDPAIVSYQLCRSFTPNRSKVAIAFSSIKK